MTCPTCGSVCDDLFGCIDCGGVFCDQCGSPAEGICNDCAKEDAMTEDLDKLQARATGIPTGYLNDKHLFQYAAPNYCISGQNWKLIFDGSGEVADKEPSGIDVAETLLAALDPYAESDRRAKEDELISDAFDRGRDEALQDLARWLDEQYTIK